MSAAALTSDSKEDLVCGVIRRSLTIAETYARRHRRRKNTKALRFGLDESKQLVKEKTANTAKAVRLANEPASATLRLTRLPSSSDGGTTSGEDDDDAPRTADAYADEYYCRCRDATGNGPSMKW